MPGLSLRLRISGACVAFLLLIGCVGWLGGQQNAQLGALAINIYDSAVRGLSFASTAQTGMLRFEMSHGPGSAPGDGVKDQLQGISDKLDVARQLAGANRTRQAAQAARDAVDLVANAGTTAERARAMVAANRALNKLVQRFNADALDVRDNAQMLAKASARQLLMALGIAVVAALVVAVVLSRAVVPPIRRAVGIADAIAAGRLDNIIATKGSDETAQLLRALGRMQQAIAGNLAALDEKRQQEAAAAAKTAARSEILDRTTREFQAAVGVSLARLAEAAAAMRGASVEMSETAEGSRSRALTVTAAAQQTAGVVQAVAGATEELAASISEVGGRVDQATQIVASAVTQARDTDHAVRDLTQAAEKIGAIVDVIRNIAGQTNLLALNATIEAARAGDSGRGFAVVAGEVKALANETARATEEIAGRIRAMQSGTMEAAAAIRAIGTTIDQMNELTVVIATAMDQQGAATAHIARNIATAAQGTGQVSDNIGKVTQAATHAGAAASQVLDAATALSGQSDDLRNQVESFLTTVRAA